MALTPRLSGLAGAACVAAACALGAGSARAEDGWLIFAQKHYEEAVALWRTEAAAGDPQAKLGLGVAYDLGQGVQSDAAMACEWYKRAADDGVAKAEFNMAVMQDDGRCGPRDAQVVAAWYSRAAARGHPRAQYDLAQLYASGDGVPRNPELARAWFEAAAHNGLAAAAEASKRLPAGGAAALAPAVAMWPKSTDVPATGDSTEVPLVWNSPEEPADAKFYLEIYATGSGAPVLVHTGYAPRSAEVVPLPRGDYAWRVLTADPASRRYAVGEWSTFHLDRPAAPAG
jgi:TPR repeat protein